MIYINKIKYYYFKNNNNISKYIFNNIFIFNKFIIIKFIYYEYVNKKLYIYIFKGILIQINIYNNIIIILKYDKNYKDIILLYFYLNSKNLINIIKLGKLNIKKIKYLL